MKKGPYFLLSGYFFKVFQIVPSTATRPLFDLGPLNFYTMTFP